MPKPAILIVDDDAEVLRAVERDLRRKYSAEYRLVRADSGQAALDVLRQLQERGDSVALLLSDQRMPQMTGVEMLQQAITLFPDAKRVLLTAYADTDAAINAINTARIDYYLTKPWDPPEATLYPVLDDLLTDWQADAPPSFDGLRLIGHRWSPEAHQLKDFLARNQVPYVWLDIESSEQARKLAEGHLLPLAILADGTQLIQPTTAELAGRIGFKTQAELPFYDLAIVGGGPAGLAAAVYGASEGLKTVMIEREAPGGQAGTSSRIENYLGFPSGLTGADLARRGLTQAKRFGVEVLSPQEVMRVRCNDSYRVLTLADGAEISCHALLIATGVSYRKLDALGIEQLTGAGVYYGAAMTEAAACRDEDVYIVGGANSAGQAAMFFARYARQVVILVRSDSLAKSMSQYLIDEIAKTPNITVRTCTSIAEAHGSESLEALTLLDANTGATERVTANGLFIFIGAQPRTDWLNGVVERDKNGFVLAGADLLHDGKRPANWPLRRDPLLLETSMPGIFVAGDVRYGSVKRVAAGVGEGSIAVQIIHQYLAAL